MSKIDLSKAKIGDIFRTRDGIVVKYVDYDKLLDLYIVSSEHGKSYPVQEDGRFLREREGFSDLIMQVIDKSLDELIQEATKQIKGSGDAIAEENELQRRQEVVELAERIFFSDRGNIYSFKECVEIAEYSVNIRNQYLKDGKLC